MHFPFYVFRENIFDNHGFLAKSPEATELNEYYSAAVPQELKDVFTNPGFTLNDLCSTYKAHDHAGLANSTWLNEQLHKALYGQDDSVYRWFRLGQVSVAVYRDAVSSPSAYQTGLQALTQLCSSCGLNNSTKQEIIAFFEGVKTYCLITGKNAVGSTGALFSLFSEVASREDRRRAGGMKGGVMKLVAMVVLMLVGLIGFYLFSQEVYIAILWLLFVTISIPPILAVVFESEKLDGGNIVQLYRAGLRGLPILGKIGGNMSD